MSNFRRILANPYFLLIASLEAAILFALAVIALFSGERRFFYLYYFAPIAAPFVAFLLDRIDRFDATPYSLWILDLLVVGFALARAFRDLPVISGHALFLTYALLTVRSRVARWLAAVVLVEVIYLKVFVWHDATLYGGAAVAALCAGLYWLGLKMQRSRHGRWLSMFIRGSD